MHVDLSEEPFVSALRGESDRSSEKSMRPGKLERGCNGLHELGCAELLERGCCEPGGVASSTGATALLFTGRG